MSQEESESDDERTEPLPAPIPGLEFGRLSRGQSVAAWTLGLIIGIALAGAVITIVLFLV